MSIQPQLSIVVPVYNVEKYLRECVDSIVKQNNGNIEVVLVDDGSKDTSGIICDSYSKQYFWIKTIHQSNRGLGGARNAGMKQATGMYIWYVDADDLLAKDAISTLFMYLHKDLDIIMFSGQSFSDGAKVLMTYDRKDKIGEMASGREILRSNMCKDAYMTSVCIRAYRKCFIERIGLKFSDEQLFEDEEYAFRTMYEAEKVLIIEDALYLRRYRQGSKIYSVDNTSEEAFVLIYESYSSLLKRFIYLYMNEYKNETDEYRKIFIHRAAFYYVLIVKKFTLLNIEIQKKHRWKLLKLREDILKYKDKMPFKFKIMISNIYMYILYTKVKYVVRDATKSHYKIKANA